MIGLDEQIELFKLVGAELSRKIECFIIGGSAMMFYGFKSATKDVDFVFLEEDEINRLKKTLEKIGFHEKKMGIEDRKKDSSRKGPVVMERKEARFDLFLEDIFAFRLSPGIASRVKEVHEFGNLIVKVVSQEDIILLKCATDRIGDSVDVRDIANKHTVDWKVIIEESLWQTKEGRKIFPLFLYDFLVDLKEDFKLDIPKSVLVELRRISEGMLYELEKKKKSKLTKK